MSAYTNDLKQTLDVVAFVGRRTFVRLEQSCTVGIHQRPKQLNYCTPSTLMHVYLEKLLRSYLHRRSMDEDLKLSADAEPPRVVILFCSGRLQ